MPPVNSDRTFTDLKFGFAALQLKLTIAESAKAKVNAQNSKAVLGLVEMAGIDTQLSVFQPSVDYLLE